MAEYLSKVLDNLQEEITDTPETPDEAELLNVRDNNEQEILEDTRAQAFHQAVEQLLFIGI